MIAQQWEQVKELFESALNQSPHERKKFLERLAQQNTMLAEEVSRLLSAYEEAGEFLNQPCPLSAEFFEEIEAEAPRFSAGEILCARFRLIRLLGKGGMGEVYEAWDQVGDRAVALKTLRLEASADRVFIARFQREFQLAQKVTHPNVCRIFDIYKHDVGNGSPISILSMELLQGQTLAEYLRERGRRLSVAEAMPVVRQIIEGLAAVHAAGIVHRDLKPSNLILVPDREGYRIKLTDFGIAGRIATDQSSLSLLSLTGTGGILGTPDYMAPEQLEHGTTSFQSDIYSLGLILYEMVAGKKPFLESAAWRRIHEDACPARGIATDLPPRWDRLIRCCLERDPKYRFATAPQVLENIREGPSRLKVPPKPLLARLRSGAKSNTQLLATIFIATLALSGLLFRYLNQRPEIPGGTTILLTEIKTADRRFTGLTVALKSELEQSAHFAVAVPGDEKIVKALKEMRQQEQNGIADDRTAREAALRAGCPLVVSGTLTQTEQHYVLALKIERVNYTPLFAAARWTQSFTASESDLLKTVGSAATWVRAIAKEPAAELANHNRPIQDITTTSWAALRLLNEANTMVAQSDYRSAESLLRSAIHEDPNFALAHMRLADIFISARRDNEGYIEWQKTIAAIRTMESHNGQALTDRENLRIKGQYYEDTGDYAKAEQIFRQFKERYPDDYLAWFYWASTLDSMNRKDDARQAFLKAIAIKPDASAVHTHLAMLYMSMKKYSLAISEADSVKQLGEPEWATWLTAYVFFLRGDFGKALALAGQLTASPDTIWQGRGYLAEATFLAEMGQRRKAIGSLEKGIAIDQGNNVLKADEADKQIALAYLYYRGGESANSRQLAIQAISVDDSPRHLMEAGTLLARLGDFGSASKLLHKLEIQPDIPRVRFAVDRLQGEIALAQKHADRAASYFRAASLVARPIENQAYYANGLIAAGSADQAEQILKGIADAPAYILLYRDHDFLGLWGDSLLELASLNTADRRPLCPYQRLYLGLRKDADHEASDRTTFRLTEPSGYCTSGN